MATSNTKLPNTHSSYRMPASVDYIAVGIGLALALLVRFGVLHQIGF
ncbi:MAG TPA: hypothetical protein VG714_02220 [Acidobacteriaceae bacterium]|nr:hypothetical protein [Acidobacteriaceae bacterium]